MRIEPTLNYWSYFMNGFKRKERRFGVMKRLSIMLLGAFSFYAIPVRATIFNPDYFPMRKIATLKTLYFETHSVNDFFSSLREQVANGPLTILARLSIAGKLLGAVGLEDEFIDEVRSKLDGVDILEGAASEINNKKENYWLYAPRTVMPEDDRLLSFLLEPIRVLSTRSRINTKAYLKAQPGERLREQSRFLKQATASLRMQYWLFRVLEKGFADRTKVVLPEDLSELYSRAPTRKARITEQNDIFFYLQLTQTLVREIYLERGNEPTLNDVDLILTRVAKRQFDTFFTEVQEPISTWQVAMRESALIIPTFLVVTCASVILGEAMLWSHMNDIQPPYLTAPSDSIGEPAKTAPPTNPEMPNQFESGSRPDITPRAQKALERLNVKQPLN
jgi:hypothetical protein